MATDASPASPVVKNPVVKGVAVLVFIIDEVGQHVARSGDKLRRPACHRRAEEFGKIGKNLLKAHKIVAPCWIVVTSQEKLDEVVSAIDSKRVELAKLQDRFHHRVDLAPSDIREVATKRVLAKKEAAVPVLTKLYKDHQRQLNAALRLERRLLLKGDSAPEPGRRQSTFKIMFAIPLPARYSPANRRDLEPPHRPQLRQS